MGERKSPDAGQTTLASATAAIIAARWSAPAAPTPLPRRTPGAGAYGADIDTSAGLPGANGGAHAGNGYAVNGGAPLPDGNGAAAHRGEPAFAVPDATLDGLPPVSPGQPTTAPVSPSIPPVSGPPVSPAPYVHGQGPGIGAAAASYFAGTAAGGFGAAAAGAAAGGAAPSFFSPVAPDPVPEVFPTPPGREPPREAAHEEVRTQVPPGFERRNFGPFPDEATTPVGGWGLGDRAGRAEESRTPEALLGVLPPAPPAPPVAATIAPPEPAPWTDSGFVGFGDLGGSWEPASEERTAGAASGRFGRDPEPAPERTDAPVATLVPGPRTPLPRRVPRIPDFDLPGIGVVEPAADAARQQQELNRIADFLSRGDTEPVTEDRPDGVDLDAILKAIRRVPEVRDVQLLGWNDQAGHTLRIEYADGVDESEVTRSVARLLRAQLGLAGQPGVEEPTVDSPYRRGGSTGRQLSRPPVGAGRALPRPTGVATPRLVVENVTVTRLGAEATVEVRLRQPGDGGVSIGESSGPGVDAYLSRLAATAAGAAVDKVLAAGGTSRGKVFIEHVSVVPFGVVEVAVVVLLLAYDGVTEQLSGSAIVGDDPHLAVVRATLAALNRRLESLLA